MSEPLMRSSNFLELCRAGNLGVWYNLWRGHDMKQEEPQMFFGDSVRRVWPDKGGHWEVIG